MESGSSIISSARDYAPIFEQQGFLCRMDWGRRGARAAAERGDLLIVVDVLSFSTAVATAVHHGGIIYPCAQEEDQAALAVRFHAEVAVSRKDVPKRGRFSLSPLTYLAIEPGTRVVVASPNGATCSRYGRDVPHLFVGALVNARAVGEAVNQMLQEDDGLCVTVLACGERWQTSSEDGELRLAIEDYLGAGAVLSHIVGEKSPEARLCEGAFQNVESDLEPVLWECGSGRELREKGFAEDVRHASRLNIYDAVPVMRGERLERL